jgi:hypothetical protein
MAKKFTIPATLLVESRGSFGHHKDTPRLLGESKSNLGHFVGFADTEIRQTVNGVTYVMPADPRKS